MKEFRRLTVDDNGSNFLHHKKQNSDGQMKFT